MLIDYSTSVLQPSKRVIVASSLPCNTFSETRWFCALIASCLTRITLLDGRMLGGLLSSGAKVFAP